MQELQKKGPAAGGGCARLPLPPGLRACLGGDWSPCVCVCLCSGPRGCVYNAGCVCVCAHGTSRVRVHTDLCYAHGCVEMPVGIFVPVGESCVCASDWVCLHTDRPHTCGGTAAPQERLEPSGGDPGSHPLGGRRASSPESSLRAVEHGDPASAGKSSVEESRFGVWTLSHSQPVS